MLNKKSAIIASLFLAATPFMAFAEGAEAAAKSDLYAIAAAIAIGVAAFGGTFAQGKAVSSALESIGRNPSASGNLFVPMLLGLAFIESLVVLAFVIAQSLLS
jgi:F-type H+-transporting ATPase subunit c